MKLRLLPLLTLLLLPLMAHARLEVLDRIVAVVNDSVITQSQLDARLNTIKQQITSEQQPLPPADILRQQVLNHMILADIQLQLASRAGIKIDDSTLDQTLADIAMQNHMTLAQFAKKIREDGQNWVDFREQIRQQMAIARLRQGEVGKQVHVSDREIDQFMKSAMGKKLFSYDLHVAHILIHIPDKATPAMVEAARKKADDVEKQLRQGANFTQMAIRYSNAEDALKGGDLGWHQAGELPTLYTQACEGLSPGDISPVLKAGNGFHILKLIDRRGNSGKQILKQYKVRQILITSDALHTPAQAKALAEQLRQEVLDGKSFADLARQYSADPGSASQGGELGWVDSGEMVPSFGAAMKNTPVGKLSPVFHSRYGWHFLEVEATRDADMSAQYRRMQAADALHKRYYDEQLQLWLQKIRSEAYVDIRS
jgi:peptidyl-prolyl cis-trans isomerase SurA